MVLSRTDFRVKLSKKRPYLEHGVISEMVLFRSDLCCQKIISIVMRHQLGDGLISGGFILENILYYKVYFRFLLVFIFKVFQTKTVELKTQKYLFYRTEIVNRGAKVCNFITVWGGMGYESLREAKFVEGEIGLCVCLFVVCLFLMAAL